MALSLERINKAREAGYDDEKILESIERRDPEFGARIKKARDSGYDSKSIMQSIEKRLNTPINTPAPKENPPEKITPIESDNSQPEISPKEDKGFWDWVMQEPGEDQYEKMIRPKEYTPEELKAMPLNKKLEYIEDLKRHREYQMSKGVTKGALSGLTLGLSEKIPALKPKEDEHGTLFGEFLGSTLPIHQLSKLISWPLLKLAGSSPKYKAGLEAFAKMSGMGVTGATYEGAKETIKTGELPSAEDLVKHGVAWAAIDGLLQSFGLAGKLVSRLRKSGNKVETLNKLAEKVNLNEANPEKLKTELEAAIESIGEEGEATSKALNEKSELQIEKPQGETNKEIKPLETKVEVKPKELSIAKEEPVEPIIETTGQGAEQRLEYAKTTLEQNIDQANAIIEAAKTPGESLKQMGRATNEAIFNFLAPLERVESEIPIANRVSTRIKLAQTAASEINSVLENGIFSNVSGQFEHQGLKGAYGDLTWKKFTKGLKPQEYSLQELDTYRASRAALRRQGEGKKTGIDTAKAMQDVERLRQKYGPIDQRIREYNKKVLEVYGKDLIGAEKIKQWNEKYYAPLFRVMDSGKDSILRPGSLQPKQPFKKMKGSERKIVPPSESDPYNTSMLISNAKKNDAVLQYKQLVVEGKLPGKVRGAKNEALPEGLLEQLDLDPELEELAETVYNQTRKDSYTPRKNILKGWENGKPFEIEVPEDVFNVFSTFAPQDRSLIATFFGASNRLFSRGISLAPKKALSIFSRDALSSLIYSRTGSNPISLVEAMGDIYGDKEVYKQFKALGGDVYAARLAQRIDRANKIEDLITPGKEGILVPFENIGSWFKKYGETLGDMSMAVPLAEYKRALQVYGDTAEGRLMAAMEARRITYDPTRKGGSKIVRELGNYIPFWNVSLQDFSILGNALKNPSTWAKGFGAITVPSLMLKMLNEDNPDYQSLTAVDKAAFWHLYFGDKHLRIPIPWLLGTTFKVGPEMFFDLAKERGGEGWNGLWNNFLDNLSGDIPPIFQTYVEWQTGKSLPSPVSTILGGEANAPEVVPKRLQGLPNKYQYTSKTSQLARKFGELWDISPIKLERAIKSNTGTLGADALALIDEIAYQTGLAEDKRPEQREANYLLLGNFISTSPPSRTKYANQFYEYLEESKHEKETVKREGGKPQKSLAHLQSYNARISKKFKEYRDIEESKIDPKLKKKRLDEKQKEINALYKEAVEKVK